MRKPVKSLKVKGVLAMKKSIILAALTLVALILAAPLNAGTVYPLVIFTNNGAYAGSSDLVLTVEVIPLGSVIDFEFHNDSLVDSSMARLYFDDNSMLSYDCISPGPGTAFHVEASPSNMPAANELDPPFVADFSFGADSALPENGINPGESLTISFNLIAPATASDITDALNDGSLRIGAHIIALPDGSSEAAVPEPATILFLGLGASLLCLRRYPA